ncbi:MAG: hotdog fold thioesterase [Ferruginibacter sp.]
MANNSIWFNKDLSLSDLQITGNTMGTHLGMQWVEVGADYLKMSMPVDERTKQPYGLLHGGASCALAETVGSVASYYVLDPAKFICVGLEINANHIRSAREGLVIATATRLHLGSSTHVWDIKIHDEKHMLICVSRLTVAILKAPHPSG